MNTVQWQYCRGNSRGRMYSLKGSEYIADFTLVVKRVLGRPVDREIFRLHFLDGLDWRSCCRLIGIDRGNFFHAIYRIEQRAGRALAEVKPYPLYPLREYFSPMPMEVRTREYRA